MSIQSVSILEGISALQGVGLLQNNDESEDEHPDGKAFTTFWL
jgi:hypothetical protein